MSQSRLQHQILLRQRPVGLPTEDDFARVETPIPTTGQAEVKVETLVLSLDPAMRGWMMDRKSYLPPVGLGEVMRAFGVGRVVESNHPLFAEGDRVTGPLGWQEVAVLPGDQLSKLPAQVPSTLALGPLGMTGLTAYFGLLGIGQPQAGETVLVSAAAGAVGSVVGQIARIQGCRVIGTAGTDEKCRWLVEELGFDAAINYKTHDDLAALQTAVAQACPKGIDVYFDNVGGDLLDAALALLRRGGRIVICGAISQYNATEQVPGPANYLSLLVNRGRMEGFIILDYEKRYGEGLAALSGWLQSGELKYREDIIEGLENAPSALLRLFDGSNTGKLMVRVAQEG